MLDQVFAPDAPAERRPELRLKRAQRHVTIGAPIRAVTGKRSGKLELAAARGPPARKRLGGHHRQPRERPVEHRRVDDLALAGALSLTQRDHDPERRRQRPAADIRDLARCLHRRAIGVARQAQEAVEAEVVHVVPGAIAVGAILAVAGDGAVDEPRIALAQALVADAQAVEHARPKRLEQHVGVLREAQQHLSALLGLQIDPDRALTAVQREEQRATRGLVGALVVRRRPADVVAQSGVLDLDHVGAEVGQQQRAEPTRKQPREVEDASVPQRERVHAAVASAGRGLTPSSVRASCTVAGRRPSSSVSCLALAIRSPLERAMVPSGR